MTTDTSLSQAPKTESVASIDCRTAARITLALKGQVVLAGGVSLPCMVHDMCENGIGITIDRVVASSAGPRLHVRCGDRIAIGVEVPGEARAVRGDVRVCRVWCRDGAVEMGLSMQRIAPQALDALVRAADGAAERAGTTRQRKISPDELVRSLRAVADDVFPRIAERLEDSANTDDFTQSGSFFRALVQIEATKPEIAERFVHLAMRRLMPDAGDGLPDASPKPWRFDHLELACAFSKACDLREGNERVRLIVEDLVVAASFKHLAPPLAASSL